MIPTSCQVLPLQLIYFLGHKGLKKKKSYQNILKLYFMEKKKRQNQEYRNIQNYPTQLEHLSLSWLKKATHTSLQRMLLMFRWKVSMIFTEQNRSYLYPLHKRDLLKEPPWRKRDTSQYLKRTCHILCSQIAVLDENKNNILNSHWHPETFMWKLFIYWYETPWLCLT